MNDFRPATWNEFILREVCEPTKTWNPQREKRDYFWYVDVSAVSRDSYSIREPQKLNGIDAPSRARKVIRAGDVIFATVRPTLRRVAIVGKEFDNQIASTAFCIVRAAKGKANSYFLYYLLLTDFLNEEIAKFESGASYPAVTDKDVLDRQIWLPPRPEQKKIAAALREIQQAIDIEESVIQTTRELKQSAVRQLFTRGLRSESQKETEIGPIPESWEIKTLKNVFDCFDDKRVPVRKNDRKTGSYPYYGASGIVDYVDDYLFDDELLLIAEDGENLETRKLPIAFIASGKFWVNNHAHVLKNRSGNLKFYEEYISYMEIRNHLTGTTRPKLNQGMLMQMLLPFPSEEEQGEIANILSVISEKISLHERKRALLQELFKSLLHQLMTGEISVAELDIDTSEVTQF